MTVTAEDLEIVWENPPPRQKRGRKNIWKGILAVLKQKPGQWARVNTYKDARSANSGTSSLKRLYPQFEFRPAGEHIYARYVGNKAEEEANN